MKKICVMTATRAEYGLLRPVIQGLVRDDSFDTRVVVTGAHLSPEFGLTYKEIEADGIKIDEKIEILVSSDAPSAISKSMALALIGFAEYFKRTKPDLLIVLGDRYETLAVCSAAMNERIPIAHLYGGETTEGAIDESIRHSISKMSYLHFTSTEEYRKRVIQLGEDPSRVYAVGALGVEAIKDLPLLSRAELGESLGLDLSTPFAMVTFHPVTLEKLDAKSQFEELLAAVSSLPEMKFVFTKANADAEGRTINSLLDQYVETSENASAFDSLGQLRYLSALKYCEMVVGNSSSGLIEAPSFKVPTVNIGDRQKGRIQAESVINCAPQKEEIISAIKRAESLEFRAGLNELVNPYGDGFSSSKIIEILHEYLDGDNIELKKSFYDVAFDD